VIAAGAALAGAGLALQILVFTLASAASLLVLRPIARRHLQTPTRLRSGTAALVGSDAYVTERVDGRGGQVKLSGELWTARAFDDDEVIEPGARVRVMQIEGATALVANGLE
jgi:membrane protein implicated in regulation of membrane protease activity